jgi:hypothetical protein
MLVENKEIDDQPFQKVLGFSRLNYFKEIQFICKDHLNAGEYLWGNRGRTNQTVSDFS